MKKELLIWIVVVILNFNTAAPTHIVNNIEDNSSSLMNLVNFHINDYLQPKSNSNLVDKAIIKVKKETTSFNYGVIDPLYYYKARMKVRNINRSFYLGIDISSNYTTDLFQKITIKNPIPYLTFNLRDHSSPKFLPIQTINYSKLTSRDALIKDYNSETYLDGNNSDTDYFIKPVSATKKKKTSVFNNFYSTNKALDKSSSENVVIPIVDFLTTKNSTSTITSTWDGTMLGDDKLSVTLNGTVYTPTNGLIINNLSWSLQVIETLSPSTHNIVSKATRNSNNKIIYDSTNNELLLQDAPFNCDYNAYLFQHNDVYAIDLASGSSYEIATDITEGKINAAAYNPADGYIWGSLSTPSKTIVRIDQNFNTTTFYIDELPTTNRFVGGISATGIYYLKGNGTTYYSINLDPNSSNFGQYIATLNLTQNISHHDWAFNAIDDKLYTVEKNSNILYRINAETGFIENLGVVPILSGLNYTYGAVYFDATGRFYVSSNQTGTIYVIQNVQDLDGSNTMDSSLFAYGPSSSSNDGARCPTAPVPQEDCINGIDDDGDGLIDCDDPSCSGIATCPTIDPSTSGGNDGGLESNNRVSEQIAKRNFNRTKNNYKFDKNTAKIYSKSLKYGKKTTNKDEEFKLSDLIPLEIINEDHVIESSPKDLIDLTNAINVYSVDYLRANKTIGSILILETKNGVYEHTKYICDRLLGAQLISVSTIEIRDQKFIKALIRNIDGSLEFVLSLSAKTTNDGNNFAIESHWNLDNYEDNIGYYNFQIWSNSLDDLLSLGEEVVRLLEVQKPIATYNNSVPPTVFVRSGKYSKGKLYLQIINTNRTESIYFNSGLRRTETNTLDNKSLIFNLNKNYISDIEVDIGNLFDIGLRIGDGIKTPDDLFISDGPWGYDASSPSTIVNDYLVKQNEEPFSDDAFAIERNLELTAITSEYISAFRTLTPKFSPIDLSRYNSFQLKGKGTGTLIIRLVKLGISEWELQYKTNIFLTENLQDYNIPFTAFNSINGNTFEANDITSIVFTMLAENGEVKTKEMTLQQLRFSTSNVLWVESVNTQDQLNKILASPNPMKSSTTIHFTSEISETVKLLIYNQFGCLAKSITHQTVYGKNEIELNRDGLDTGLYFCKLESNYITYKTTKILMK